MKIAILGDTHANTNATIGALSSGVAHGADLFIQVGDFGYWPKHINPRPRYTTRRTLNSVISMPANHGDYRFDPDSWDFGDKVSDFLVRHNKELWFVDGNHENFTMLLAQPVDEVTGRRYLRPNVAHLPRGYRHNFEGHEWLFVGGAASIDRYAREAGLWWFPQEYITEENVTHAIEGGTAEILVTHEAPNSPTILNRFIHLNDLDDDPDLRRSTNGRDKVDDIMTGTGVSTVLHGHMHHFYEDTYDLAGVARRVVGLGRDGQPKEQRMCYVDETGTILKP